MIEEVVSPPRKITDSNKGLITEADTESKIKMSLFEVNTTPNQTKSNSDLMNRYINCFK